MPIHFNQPDYYSSEYALALNATLEAIRLEFSEPADLSEQALETIESTFSFDASYVEMIRENPNILREEIGGTFEDLILYRDPEIIAWCLGDALRCSIELKETKSTLAEYGCFGSHLILGLLSFRNSHLLLEDDTAYIYYGRRFSQLSFPQLQIANATALLINYMSTRKIEPCWKSFLDHLPMYPSLYRPFQALKESTESS
jgi:hypothetical protein